MGGVRKARGWYAVSMGADATMRKPVEPNELLRTVASLEATKETNA